MKRKLKKFINYKEKNKKEEICKNKSDSLLEMKYFIRSGSNNSDSRISFGCDILPLQPSAFFNFDRARAVKSQLFLRAVQDIPAGLFFMPRSKIYSIQLKGGLRS